VARFPVIRGCLAQFDNFDLTSVARLTSLLLLCHPDAPKKLNTYPKYIVHAGSKAQKVADYILGYHEDPG
jgi:hypothetical protein